MNQNKLSGMLGIAKKAGKTVVGTDMVTEAIRSSKSKVALALLSADASANTVKRITNAGNFHHVTVKHLPIAIDSAELGRLLGKASAISTVAIVDKGFAEAILKLMDTVLPDENEENTREDKV